MKTIVAFIILSFSLTSFSQVTNGLVGHWPLDNNANDVVGTNNGAAFGVQPTVDRDGNSNSAYEFDANRYIQLGDPATFDFGSQPFTLSAWVNRTQTAFNYENVVMSKWNTGASPGTNEWIFALSPHTSGDNPVFSIEIGMSKHQVVSTVELNLNEWYHVAAVRRTTTIEIYVNGALTGIKSIPNLPVNNVGRDLQIGRFGTNFYLEGGELDDIKIFNRDLSQSEITQLHSSTNQVSTTNTFLGFSAGENNTTGESNVFVGSTAGEANTTGYNNVFVGADAGDQNTTGRQNAFMGSLAGQRNSTGEKNIFIGSESGRYNKTGTRNVFMGVHSGVSNVSGYRNTFIGNYAGNENETGYENVALGNLAGNENVSGNRNVFLGNKSGHTNVSGSGNVFIGSKSGFNEIGSEKLYIDNTDTTTPLLYGDFSSDQLGVNTNVIPAGYTFAVKGKMIAEQLKIDVFPWSDFVFENDYKLPTLAEVEEHIHEKGHLQDIPSAAEVAKNGINVGQMNAKLLQKIEELTLYTIQQQKELQQQKEINRKLAERLRKIEQFLTNNLIKN